ncbi:MAG: ribulose-phosphate 3-epimerase [Clostridia bacterium]|nr:ribulose-phosphate 3-epimerase [Clostridia bacterium]
MNKKISPSIMCVDFFKLDDCIKEFEKNGIELIHIDVMDGSFVPNFTLGTDFVKTIRSKTNIPVDIHLMVQDPESKLEWFDFGENDYVAVHWEATRHLHKAVAAIKAKGAKAMVAISPATPLCALDSILDDIDAVLVMTVNPGFAGQKLIASTLKKIKTLREYLDKNGYEHIEIEVDGNVSFENAKLMNEAGANIFVAGTSSVFSKQASMSENIKRLKNILV